MKIAELKEHHAAWVSIEARITQYLAARAFAAAFAACAECYPHVVPTIKCRKQAGIEPETPDFLCFNAIFDYAPPLFEHAAIESLIDFINSTRMLAKHVNAYLQQAEAARARLRSARHVWNRIEEQSGFLQQDLGRSLNIDQSTAVGLVEHWEHLGVIVRRKEQNSYALFFRSHLDAEATGMCPSCGVHAAGRRELFYRPTVCKRCGMEGYYHLSAISLV